MKRKWTGRGRWLKKYAEYVEARFADYKTSLECKNKYFELNIFNPNVLDRDIKVVFDDLQATFYFSFQHAHFGYEDEGIEQLVEYIQGFISGQYVAYEFFEDGKNAMGGSRNSCDVNLTSAESIIYAFYPDWSEEQIEQAAIYWSEADTRFTYEEHKKIISESPGEDRENHLELFKECDYSVGIESWSGKIDAYKQIHWDGKDFQIIDIAKADLIKQVK